MQKIFLSLLIFVPITILAKYAGVPDFYLFFLAAIAIIPLSKFIGEATEELASHTNSAFGGFLNATFGNAVELIISIFAIRAGLAEVVKASITGSIIGNLLLVTGLSILIGGWKREKQVFNKTAAVASGSTLLLAVIALTMPAIFFETMGNVSENLVENLSIFVSIFMLFSYFASLFFSLKTHKHLYTEELEDLENHNNNWTVNKSIIILLTSTLAVAWVSEILVSAIEPLAHAFGWTELFIGVVLIAIIGNAAEHASAITTAIKNRMDLSLQISIGSATQIAMFVAPFLVLFSYFYAKPVNLVFNSFELISIILSIFITNKVVEDGESNWFEGLQLLLAYLIMAVAFYFHP